MLGRTCYGRESMRCEIKSDKKTRKWRDKRRADECRRGLAPRCEFLGPVAGTVKRP